MKRRLYRYEESKIGVPLNTQRRAGAARRTEYRSRTSTLSMAQIRDSGHCVAVPDVGWRFFCRATCCTSPQKRHKI